MRGLGRMGKDLFFVGVGVCVCVCLYMRVCFADILILMHVNVRSLHPFMIMIGVTWWHVGNPSPS